MATAHHLLAVMRDERSARDVARTLTEHGIDPRVISIDDANDEAPALRAEMHAELSDSIISPHASVIVTKEGARGTALVTLVVGVIAVGVSALVALIDFGGPYLVRFAVTALFALFLVFVGSYVLGGAWGWNPEEPAASERGVTVRVGVADPEVVAVVVEADPIRIDEITSDGRPVATVYTEGHEADHHVVPKVTDTVHHIENSTDDQQM